MSAANEQLKRTRHGPVMFGLMHHLNSVARCHFAFFDNPEIPTATTAADDHTGEAMHAKMMVELPTWLTPLRDLDHCPPDAKTVANAQAVFG